MCHIHDGFVSYVRYSKSNFNVLAKVVSSRFNTIAMALENRFMSES